MARPTKLKGETGLANWLEMFASDRLQYLSTEAKTAIIEEVEQELRPNLYRNSHWYADYYRLRIVATK